MLNKIYKIINFNKKGFSLVELLVAVAVFGILAAGVFQVATSNYNNFYGVGDRQAITEFAKEGAEAVRAIRDASWQDIENQPLDTDLGLAKDANGEWYFFGNSNIQGPLTRSIRISQVSRDNNGNIVLTGGAVDPSTKKITVKVVGEGIDDYELIIYISNWSVRSWAQDDWDGSDTRSFWSAVNMASSFTNLATSTSGELKLSGDVYTASKKITIDSDKVAGTANHKDFPVMISTTLDSLKTTAHGGQVSNDNGYDIIFTSDSGGSTQLDHEIDSYSSSTGALIAWVRIPSLDYNDDTIFYMLYGNSKVTTSQEDRTGTWGSDYAAVFHMKEDPSIYTDGHCSGTGMYYRVCDSTSNGNHTYGNISTDSRVAGPVGQAIDFDGIDDYLVVVDSASLDGVTGAGQSRTISFWLYMTTGADNKILTEKDPAFNGSHLWLQTQGTGGDIIGGVSASGKFWLDATPSPGTGAWKYVSMVYDGKSGNGYLYVDGALSDGPEVMIAPDDDNYPLYIGGYGSGSNVDANFDELRISSYAKGSSWIQTEYNNMNSPETFYYIGPNDFSYYRSITIDADQVSGTTDILDYPFMFSTTSDSLKTIANGGRLNSEKAYDLIFTTDAAGTNQLDHEIESYDPVSGAFTAWVSIPTLDYNDDTTIYLQYGSSTITTSQENIADIWSDYAMVYHLGEPLGTTGVGSVDDSTGNTAGTPSSGLVFGATSKSGGAVDFSSGTGISAGTVGSSLLEATTTISFWTYMFDFASPSRQNPFNQAYGGWGTMTQETSGAISYYMGSNGGNGSPYENERSQSDQSSNGVWVYNTAQRQPHSNYQVVWYKNGSYNGNSFYPGDPIVINDRTFTIGDGYVNPINGIMDEFRIENNLRSNGEIATEYNNMNSPETFYSIGTETEHLGDRVVAGGYDSPGTIISSIFDLGSSQKNISTISFVQDLPTGCDITVILEADDNNNFSTAVSEEFSGTTNNVISNVTSTLDGKRWMRYQAELTACGANDQDTPTLYSVQIDYR